MRVIRVVLAAIVTAAGIAGLAGGSAGAGERMSFEQYSALDDAVKARMAASYVKRQGRFHMISVSSYLVRTDISALKAMSLAVEMDEFQRRFSKIFVGRFRINSRPELYVLKDKASYFNAYKVWAGTERSAPEFSAGLFSSLTQRKHALFANAAFGEAELHKTLYHEGTHQLLEYYIASPIPRWFDEGCATNFEEWNVKLSAQRNIYNSMWNSSQASIIYMMHTGKSKYRGANGNIYSIPGFVARKPRLQKLFALDGAAWNAAADDDATANYAEAWSFINFLLTYGETGQRYFDIFIGQLKRGMGRDPEKLLPPRDRQVLEGLWKKYLDDFLVPHFEYSRLVGALIKRRSAGPAAGVIAEGLKKYPKNPEMLYFKGLLELEAGRAKEALAILAPLEKRFPRHPLLFRTLGRAALAAGERVKARKWILMALAEDTTDDALRAIAKKAGYIR